MADTSITGFTAILGSAVDAAADVLPIVDVSAGATGNRKILVSQLFAVPTQTLVTPIIGVATATSINKVAITAPATLATLTLIDGTTLTGPAASGTAMTLGNAETVTGAKTFGTIGGTVGKLILAGSTSGSSILNAAAVAGSTTLTLPGTTGTIIIDGNNAATTLNIAAANNNGFCLDNSQNNGLLVVGSNVIGIAAGGAYQMVFGNTAATVRMRSTITLGWCSSDSGTGTLDTAMSRNAAGVIEANNGTAGTLRDFTARNVIAPDANGAYIKLPGMTVANLPAAPVRGMRCYVTDSNAASYTVGIGSTVAAGGSTIVPVFYNGTAWLIG